MATHPAVVMVGVKAPLEVHQVPTPTPKDDEVKVRVEWTASTPLDMHRADGGLFFKHPEIMGGGMAGTVITTGPSVTTLKPGDKVFGWGWRNEAEKSHQLYCVLPSYLIAKLPSNITMQAAVTVPNNFVTVYHVFTSEFGFSLPWPKPSDHIPKDANTPILIWGGSSSCGMYAIQLLHYFGYTNILTTASKPHHAKLQAYGATTCFDYRDADIISNIHNSTTTLNKPITHILDCIGSLTSSISPLSKIATHPGTILAILTPVIIRESSDIVTPLYSMDVNANTVWAEGVITRGFRTHFYTENEFLKQKLQSEIMPRALELGVIEPNEQVVVQGGGLLERAEKALGMLRRKEVSGGRLVWRVAEVGEGGL